MKQLWQMVAKEVGWRHYRYKPISALFHETKATEAILAFIDTTGVGKLRGGLGVDEEREDVIEVEDEADEEDVNVGE
jgi:hypothetical protein